MAGEQLRVAEGEGRGRLLSVDTALLIGREAGPGEGTFGGDSEMSRRHALLSRGTDRGLVIEDVGSANGTFVNGERITAPRALEAGDVITVGTTRLEVMPAQAPASAPRSPDTTDELVIAAGDEAGRRLLVAEELVVGRGVTGEGRLGGDLVLSRRHARIARDRTGRLSIEDLGSANGTFVNGERVVGRRALSAGDSVLVGSTALEVRAPGRARAPSGMAPPAVPGPPAAAPTVPEPAREAELSPGSVFAGCRVEEVINHGEMGVVYRARELALERPVALKLILAEYSRDERFRERFRRESKIAAAIDHQNVIPIFDAGEQDGVLFIMMRLVEGTDMRALIAAEGQLEPLRAARIVRQVGSALDAAHARGMLHRDVKPSNVLLARRDHAYLTDFGLAKPAASVERLTRHGTVVARLEYVSPELILNQRVDARADVYALGCVLFEALTGQAPFATLQAGPQALAHLEAPRPSPLDLRPDLPPEFDDVLRRALATEPGDRFQSAGELGQAALAAAAGAHHRPAVALSELPPATDDRSAEVLTAAPRPARARGRNGLRWAIALAGLVIVAVGMVAALSGMSNL
jgi:pSer/pThr/pTyr-binding forkhead associated (FHA) protein/predicted Ser/Thr protein kinase